MAPTRQRPTGQHPTGQRPTGQRPTGQRPTRQHPTGRSPSISGSFCPLLPKARLIARLTPLSQLKIHIGGGEVNPTTAYRQRRPVSWRRVVTGMPRPGCLTVWHSDTATRRHRGYFQRHGRRRRHRPEILGRLPAVHGFPSLPQRTPHSSKPGAA